MKEPRVWLEVPDEPDDPEEYAITRIPLGNITPRVAHNIRKEIEQMLIRRRIKPNYRPSNE